MSIEAVNMDDENVLKLEEMLSKCRRQRKRLLKEREIWRTKEREVEELQEELRAEIEANLRATAEHAEKKKTLKKALAAKKQSGHEVKKALAEYEAYREREFPYKEAETNDLRNKFDRVYAEYEKRNEWSEAKGNKLGKLQSEIDEKWKNLIAFLETYQRNSKITEDVKPPLRVHCDAYINTLESDDVHRKMLKKYANFILQPSYVGGKVDNIFEHPGEDSIVKKLWNFILT